MSLFEAYSNEAAFREEFIQPLLITLGFVHISSKHGSLEFGKDYVFSEIDPFMHYRHMVVQAKHEEVIGEGKKADDLLSQSRRAFNVPYYLSIAPHEKRRVSAVYVFNSGRITEQAITQIRNDLREPAMQSNVHLFDGPQLQILRASQAQHYDMTTRRRLMALGAQCDWNIGAIEIIQEAITPVKQNWAVLEPLTHGVEEFLTNPIVTATIQYNDIGNFLNHCAIIKAILGRHLGGMLSENVSSNCLKG